MAYGISSKCYSQTVHTVQQQQNHFMKLWRKLLWIFFMAMNLIMFQPKRSRISDVIVSAIILWIILWIVCLMLKINVAIFHRILISYAKRKRMKRDNFLGNWSCSKETNYYTMNYIGMNEWMKMNFFFN